MRSPSGFRLVLPFLLHLAVTLVLVAPVRGTGGPHYCFLFEETAPEVDLSACPKIRLVSEQHGTGPGEDGFITNWDMGWGSPDLLSPLYMYGDHNMWPLFNLYARYECPTSADQATGVLHVRVLPMSPAIRITCYGPENFIKVTRPTEATLKAVDGDNTEDFRYLASSRGYNVGWDAHFNLMPGVVYFQAQALAQGFTDASTGGPEEFCIAIDGCPDVYPREPEEIKKATIEGQVWNDCNNVDGLRENNEVEVAGVPVDVYECNNPVEPVVRVHTDGAGNWAWTEAEEGKEYFVRFDMSGTPETQFSRIPFFWESELVRTDADADGRVPAFFGCFAAGAHTVDAGVCAPSLFGDPHFHGFRGQAFNFAGIHDHVYNIITTPSVHYNARFSKTKYKEHGVYQTVISEMGVRVGPSKVRVYFPDRLKDPLDTSLVVEVDGEVVPFDHNLPLYLGNGAVKSTGRTVQEPSAGGAAESAKLLGEGTTFEDDEWLIRVENSRREVVIQTRDVYFHIRGYLKMVPHIDDGVKLTNWATDAHGLLGQTKKEESRQIEGEGELLADEKWPYFLEGSAKDYEVPDGDIFSTDTTFSKFVIPDKGNDVHSAGVKRADESNGKRRVGAAASNKRQARRRRRRRK